MGALFYFIMLLYGESDIGHTRRVRLNMHLVTQAVFDVELLTHLSYRSNGRISHVNVLSACITQFSLNILTTVRQHFCVCSGSSVFLSGKRPV